MARSLRGKHRKAQYRSTEDLSSYSAPPYPEPKRYAEPTWGEILLTLLVALAIFVLAWEVGRVRIEVTPPAPPSIQAN